MGITNDQGVLQYRGTYRVLYEVDKYGKATNSAEATYIPCNIKKGSLIGRYNDDTMYAYVNSIKIYNALLKESPNIFNKFQEGDKEGSVLFPEAQMEYVAERLKARKLGKGMSPKPKRKVNMTAEQKQEFVERMNEARRKQKPAGTSADETAPKTHLNVKMV